MGGERASSSLGWRGGVMPGQVSQLLRLTGDKVSGVRDRERGTGQFRDITKLDRSRFHVFIDTPIVNVLRGLDLSFFIRKMGKMSIFL